MTARAVLSELAAMYILLGVAAIAIRGKVCAGHVFPHVTIVTANLGMPSCQRKLCLPPVVECDSRPAIGRMTRFTSRCEPACVDVITGVTVRAGNARVLEGGRCMTGFTGNYHMQSAERKVRKRVVEDHFLVPGHVVVARAALRAKLGLVYVLLGMAVKAGRRYLDQHRSAVAGLADSFGVSAVERKAGLRRMIKLGILPRSLVMAGLACAAEPLLVNILYGVAIIAGRRLTLVDFTKVTRGAGYICVLPAQRECCLGVIKFDGVPPHRNAMTSLTILSKVALVRLVRIMAAKASCRSLGPALGRSVTACARHVAMGAGQWKIRRGVIKRHRIDLYDAGVPADMVVVTQVARHALEQGAAAMKSPMVADVGSNRLVAVEA